MDVSICAFSDTHNKHSRITIPECDIAIFSGDSTSRGHKHELENFLSWYNKQTQCTVKIFIAGNHDRCFDSRFNKELESDKWLDDVLDKYQVRRKSKITGDWYFLESNLIYLEDYGVTEYGLNIWGSPYTPWFHTEFWAFGKHRGPYLTEQWNKIPEGTDILITHGPPAYIMDWVHHDSLYVGDEQLRYRILHIKPKLHIFGHIHQNWGVEEKINTTYINAAVLSHAYNIEHDTAHIIHLEV